MSAHGHERLARWSLHGGRQWHGARGSGRLLLRGREAGSESRRPRSAAGWPNASTRVSSSTPRCSRVAGLRSPTQGERMRCGGYRRRVWAAIPAQRPCAFRSVPTSFVANTKKPWPMTLVPWHERERMCIWANDNNVLSSTRCRAEERRYRTPCDWAHWGAVQCTTSPC
jgi:hypothetical protein